MREIKFLTLLAVGLTGVTAMAQLQSQLTDTVQQRRQLEQAAKQMVVTNAVPELYSGESSDVGPQSVLKIKPRRTWVEAAADVQYFYSDNMFLANNHKQDVDVLVSTVEAALAPTPYEFAGGQLAPRLGYQHQWFNYDLAAPHTINALNLATGNIDQIGLDQYDFNASTVFGDVAWRWRDWQFTIGGDFQRLLDSGDYQEFYREFVPNWSVRRDFRLNKKQCLSLAYEGNYRLTDTANTLPGVGSGFNDRSDQSLVIVGSWKLCSHAILQPSCRFQYTHYTAISRDDILSSFGLAIYCPLRDNVALRAFVNYGNFSTDAANASDYEKLDAGFGLNFAVRF
jgi:hypothetical protein